LLLPVRLIRVLLTGFGSGLPRKRWLLDHEGRYAGTRAVLPTLSVA